ncbi:MAG: cytochrome C [Ignavibacteriae bacterium]|nr:MAG: cytochrome C [Ignavibacteriota bacterium]
MKINKLYFLLLAGVLVFLSSTAYLMKDTKTDMKKVSVYPSAAQEDHSKVIKFDHKFHVKEAAVACKDCHVKANTSVSAKDDLNPGHNECSACHDVTDQKNCNFCHVEGAAKKFPPTKKELAFSHKFHVVTQKQECTACHVGVDNVKFAKESPTAFPPMEVCSTCHTEQNQPAVNLSQQAGNNCESCHTNLTNLFPKSHRQSNFLNEHKVVFDPSSNKNNCMMCHSDNFCQVCHSPVNVTGNNTSENFYAPYYSKEGATRIDRHDLQKLTTAHDLNYRFTHGLDANHKRFECKTCHDPVTFCNTCHSDNGQTLSSIAPDSHKQPMFTTFGVGTGGGLHATIARKDIESCQSCHDTQGGDPICITCHIDNDGVKGTNPRTHESGFENDNKGIWHETQGAICYTCHSDANARPNGISGVGFCGYCHNSTDGDRRFK